MSKQSDETVMTVAQAAQRLGVNAETIRRWIRSGKLQAFKRPGKGRQMFVRAADVERFTKYIPIKA